MQPSNRPRDRLWRDKSSDLEILLLPSKLAPRLQCKMMRAIRRKSTDLQSYERKSIIPVFAPIMRDGLNPLIIGGAGPWMMAGGNRAILGTGAGTGGWFYYRKHFSLFQIKLPPTPIFWWYFLKLWMMTRGDRGDRCLYRRWSVVLSEASLAITLAPCS